VSLTTKENEMQHGVVSVGTTATKIVGAGAPVAGAGSQSVKIRNSGAADVFIGGAGVTTTTGFPVAASTVLDLQNVEPGDTIFGVVASGSINVQVLAK
jgi:hypothetical protein